jgi:hypothetical protein
VLQESGVTALPVAIKVLQLKANTTYYYRLAVVGMDGTTYGAIEKVTTSQAPVISGLKISPRSFHPGGAGATISYTDSLAGRTQFVVLRCVAQKRGKCLRTSRAGALSHIDKKGRNRVAFSGRLGGRALKPGSYILEATPHAARAGATVTVTFAIT